MKNGKNRKQNKQILIAIITIDREWTISSHKYHTQCKKNVDQRKVSIFQKQSKNTAELAPYFGQIIKSKLYDDSIQCNANLLHLDDRKVYRNQIDWLQCMNNCQCLRHQCRTMSAMNRYLSIQF